MIATNVLYHAYTLLQHAVYWTENLLVTNFNGGIYQYYYEYFMH